MKFRVRLEPWGDGGYTVSVPALRGCVSEGKTLDEALANIKEAIEVYLEACDDDADQEVAVETQASFTEISV